MQHLSRRELLIAGAGTLVLAACGASPARQAGGSPVSPTDPAVAARERLRSTAGARVTTATITAAPVTTQIGGRTVDTWAFGDRPGAGGLRLTAGDTLEARFVNGLDMANTIHWHGIALRNDMDGVHDLTQPAVPPGGEFLYRFVVPDAGTHWFHPHMGLELDRGLYAPLVVEDPSDTTTADVDATLVLDDWLDGFGRTPQDVLDGLRSAGGHAGHDMGGMGGMGEMGDMSGMHGAGGMGGMATLGGDVAYPLHLVNGRGPDDRDTVTARPGQRVRLRIVNAGSDTAYRVAVAGHRLTVTHADGFAVRPVEVDAVVLGMGERYDVELTAQSGAFPVVAVAEGKDDPAAEAVLRTSTAAASPATGTRPVELAGKVVAYGDLVASDAVLLPSRSPDRTASITLTAAPGYVHGIDAKSFPDTAPVTVRQGERLRLTIMNDTMMFHPVHLHGHTFQMVSHGRARKDTVNVPAMGSVVIDIEADNPGQWMLHCHNTYHLETGMATVFSYRA